MYISLEYSKIVWSFGLLGLVYCAFFHQSTATKETEPHLSIFESYSNNFKVFGNELSILAELVEAAEDAGTIRDQLVRTRLSYKKIEFLFDYLEPEYVYLYINGGPLPKLHKEVAEIDIIPPNGLQRLDELVFSNEIIKNKAELKTLVHSLVAKVDFIQGSHFQDTISAQNSIEALRSGMIRVFTLGLTGFDTPGSGNAMQESLVSIQAMRNAFAKYTTLEKTEIKAREILSLYDKGISMLESQPDFASFDRLQFLIEVVNPIYRELRIFQEAADIDDHPLLRHAQNYETLNLFDENFLDRNYFTQYAYDDINDPKAISLGKKLFYDPILSKDVDLSCASCHDPKKGFADGLPRSPANRHGHFTKRNAPTLIDAGYSSKYFWDLREHDLEKQVAHVVEDALEFNIRFEEIASRLRKSKTYVNLFEEAYGDIAKQDIHRRSISNAIAAYVNTLTSFNSVFDRYVRGETEEYDAFAKQGFNLFMGKATCGTCHFAPVFNGSVSPFYTDAESEVLGVTEGFHPEHPVLDMDMGRRVNGRKGDAHQHFDRSFKTVTVRNAALTAPYMHNGSFDSLEDVIEFYNVGGGQGMGLEIENQTLAPDSLHLSDLEKRQLVAFMHSLTDTTGLNPGIVNLPTFENEPYWNDRGKPKVID